MATSTCPVEDSRFMAIVQRFENCQSSHSCAACPLENDCLALWDTLSEKCSDKPLSEANYTIILKRFKRLHFQSDFTFNQGL